jgi:hypothetical protein
LPPAHGSASSNHYRAQAENPQICECHTWTSLKTILCEGAPALPRPGQYDLSNSIACLEFSSDAIGCLSKLPPGSALPSAFVGVISSEKKRLPESSRPSECGEDAEKQY